ncbi:adenylate/guanylate cyclase domain-containing protein [Pseudophaeobacter arcticus]|uniref:adenylate/guanylate cyclase domain-containing protein n=1 Tax=Pseudophaeobacter arcticus TaxID=385492 RepID=UPI0024927F57|nr:adenylate/guanylate cyclase domain-containing protein [Pseudophaeobacter arcticus]
MTSTSLDTRLLHQAEVKVERIVAVLRIGVAFCLLSAFLFLVQGEGADQPYLRIQWLLAFMTLVFYFLLGGVSYWLAVSGRFRRWMVWPAVTLDCVFMLVNTWAGLSNTGLPGELTFLLPPTWLVPVILAFAVLRFNPYLQAYCVALVVGGLAFLTFWQPETVTPFITARVEIMVMQPPNMVRVVMIAMGGVVLIVAAYRTRKLLHSSIEDARARANLTRYLPAQIADRLAAGELSELRKGRQQEMVVMFVDIRGFTNWSEGRAPEEVGAYISEFRRRVQRAVGQNQGMIDKFIGDAAMILFEGERAAIRSLGCIDDLLAELQDWGKDRQAEGRKPVRVGIGLHLGEVFSGVVGDAQRLEYSVFGDTVNTAARLEELTKSAGVDVIASAAVLQAAGSEPAREGWSALPAEHLRGRSSWVEIFGREAVAG